jgi:16S rRNA (guanine966-N2)-methyltransferase
VTRIVAGSAGGRRLAVPPKGTRPTSERVREALFGALEAAFDFDGIHLLDLYAGSGALGFEALSRGAGAVTFIESDRRAVEVLRGNVTALGLAGARVVSGPVESVVAAEPDRVYDIVLADPPYALTNAALGGVLGNLLRRGWLAPDGLVVLERAGRDGEPDWPDGLRPTRSRRYGDTVLHWAQRSSE